MPFSFNPFSGQLDYTDPNIITGVAASLAHLSGDVLFFWCCTFGAKEANCVRK